MSHMPILGLCATDEVILSLWRATWRRKPRRRRRQPRRRRPRRSSLRADSFLYLWTRDVAAKRAINCWRRRKKPRKLSRSLTQVSIRSGPAFSYRHRARDGSSTALDEWGAAPSLDIAPGTITKVRSPATKLPFIDY